MGWGRYPGGRGKYTNPQTLYPTPSTVLASIVGHKRVVRILLERFLVVYYVRGDFRVYACTFPARS